MPISLEGCCALARLRQFLLELVSEQDLAERRKEVAVRLPLRRYEIATYLGITPVHLSRLVKVLEEERPCPFLAN